MQTGVLKMFTMNIVCIIILLVLSTNYTQGELFTSISQLTSLVESHSQITQILQDYVDYHQNALDKASLLLEDFEKITELSKPDAEKFIGNPVNAFLLIKKLTKDLQQFVEIVNTSTKLNETIGRINNEFILPSEVDYNGAIVAIQRLENTYQLKPDEIREGLLLSDTYPTARPLTLTECFEFGRVAYETGDYHHATNWLSESLDQSEIADGHESIDPRLKINILKYLSLTQGKISLQVQKGHLEYMIDLNEQILKMNSDDQGANQSLIQLEKDLEKVKEQMSEHPNEKIRIPYILNPRPEYNLDFDQYEYESQCRGDYIQKREKSTLTCRYANHDYQLLIAPVKEELVNEDPHIWIYHDVFTDKQIETLKMLTLPKLERSMVVDYQETVEYRISKSAWLNDSAHPSLAYLTRLVSALTNLTMDSAEPWQMLTLFKLANYGLGGQYEPHMDSETELSFEEILEQWSSLGNRIATWLSYLESPEIGGATVFTKIGLRVEPKRRSAVFWHNLLKNGNSDLRTQHAACPVLLGNKWASNKWLHQIGQEFQRPCDLFDDS